ncbi:hypothetical protein [Aquibacillus kalidii]|uniref:hypothetical protein n=1 Tax=Aquibacillus kalidii TaxID=2762597 RepID=UPI00164458A5|nr:hypothetical protein [Aquibacillus kalidii]
MNNRFIEVKGQKNEESKYLREGNEKFNRFATYITYDGEGNELKRNQSKNIKETVSDIYKQLDYLVDDAIERNKILHNIIGEKENGSLHRGLQSYIETEAYHYNYSNIGKYGKLSEQQRINQQLEKMADYLIDSTEDEEYPIMSSYAEDRNARKEIYINDDDDVGASARNGIHEDVVGRFQNDEAQSLITNYSLSEDKKRELRNKNIKPEDFENHPELFEMFKAKEILEKELGIHKEQTEEESEGKRNLYIQGVEDKLRRKKEKAFSRWLMGESRLSEETVIKFKKNPMKFEELLRNKVWSPITDPQELENKFNDICNFYGIANNGLSQYFKAKRIAKELGYEMTVMKERLEPPIRVKGSSAIAYDTNLYQEELLEKFDFGDYEHIESLLKIEQLTSDPVNDDNGKKIRYKYTVPLFQSIEDKHKNSNSFIEHHLIGEFRQLVKAANLLDYESAIINTIMNGTSSNGKLNEREDIYGYIINLLHNNYKFEGLNKTKLKTLVRQISKKIANTYLDKVEVKELGRVKCSKCKKEKVASERNFGKNKKNTGRGNGLKSVCKECDRKRD